jgi:hypothetical protein
MISSKTGLNHKYHQKFFCKKFIWVQTDFLENSFKPKIFIKIFFGCKMNTSKTGSNQKISSKYFVKIFFGAK